MAIHIEMSNGKLETRSGAQKINVDLRVISKVMNEPCKRIYREIIDSIQSGQYLIPLLTPPSLKISPPWLLVDHPPLFLS